MTVFDKSKLPGLLLRFKNVLVNIHGEPLEGTVQLTEKQPPCDYTELQSFYSTLDGLLEGFENTFQDTVSLKYRTDAFYYQDAWQHCVQAVNSLESVTVQDGSYQTMSCVATPGTLEYDNDPCCSPKASWSYTCVPRVVTGRVLS